MVSGLKEKIGNILMAKVLGDGGLLIKDEKQREKVMKMAKVCGKVVEKAKKTGDGPFMKGVIYSIPVEEKLEDFKSDIRGGIAINIKRLQARKGGERVDSLSMLIVFQERFFFRRK